MKNKNLVFSRLLFSIIFTMFAFHSKALVISVTPSSNTIDVGDTVTVDIVASNLGAGVAPSIGAYDLDLSFNSSLLQVDTVSVGTGLSVFFPSFPSFITNPNELNVTDLSLDFAIDLDTTQSDSFTLFSVDFIGLSAGIDALSLVANSISDASGFALVPTSITGAGVTISSTTPPPVPASAPFGLGLFVVGLSLLIRKKTTQQR